MLTTRRRAGATLVELLVAVTVGGVVLTIVAALSLEAQRFFAGMSGVMATTKQLHETAAIIPVDLRGLATGARDIPPGEARDTSIEFRASIGTAVGCDTAAGRVVLTPAGAFASFLTPVAALDTAWVLERSDTTDVWLPHRIVDVAAVPAGRCDALGPSLSIAEQTLARIAVRLDSATDAATTLGMPMRFTRPARYSLYRSSDGWYLGQREWNAPLLRFNTIQPVSGPFASPSQRGFVLQYFDSTGAELAVPVANTADIAFIRSTLRSETRRAVQIVGFAVDANGVHADSVAVSLSLRNRR